MNGVILQKLPNPFLMKNGKIKNEVLSDLLRRFPNWLGQKMNEYKERETDLPFDQHYLKALIAPRYFLQTDAVEDIWANPQGSYGTWLAAKEVYKFLNAQNKILINYREGGHAHTLDDYNILATIIYCLKNNFWQGLRLKFPLNWCRVCRRLPS